MKHSIYVITFLLLIVASTIEAEIKTTFNQPDSFNILKKNARKSESPEDWMKVIENAKARKDTTDLGFAYISYLQASANRHPDEDFVKKADPALSFLYETKQYDYYFALYNILIDWLFSHRAYSKAQDEAKRMYLQAKELEQPVGMAMALRVQGQIFYKLNLYHKAYITLQEGLKTCPPYQDNLNTFTTAQSLCEWLIMTCLKTQAYEEMLPLADLYGDMLAYWNTKGWHDPSGHYPVTHLSLRTIALLKTGRIPEAQKCMEEARTYMRPDFPARAYEHFYEARYMLLLKEGKYKEAIANIDTLLETHRYYSPFFLNDLLAKAELLSLNGQSHESIELYRHYIQANDSIAKEEIARQIDELQIQYQVEKAQQESLEKTRHLQFSLIIIVLIVLLLSLSVIYAKKINSKNRILVTQLEEHDKWIKNFSPLTDKPKGQPATTTNSQVTSHELMQQINAYMQNERPYQNTALDRKELAKMLQINERTLANTIREKNAQTVLEYITMYRLENARHLLSVDKTITIKDIAEQCGFGTLRTFQRSFRDKYGMPPSQYREITNQKNES